MSSARFEINPGAIEAILHGPQSIAQKKRQGDKLADAWRGNINRITGATDRSIEVEVQGFEVTVAADTSRDPESAWVYLEYGTSSMRAQAPGRRAIRRR
ncbi:hypothetical protein [Kibdelosporangium phytohabitans]|uniref:Uncharacterized protein n=1 Tax=Kibdelosporangium phytohabitans TaxID=860235 RepID=A0A0N9HTT2_9PSEU|nr:hypothetical protein [Kibdelosporangium phytohabitans]ALG06849.1 hypothetical protein AOZ06_07810 [Kibdelosporangium phytohabitans]MBE1468096.1 hypothetical protein [Kibdelosporangium phytohabitans]